MDRLDLYPPRAPFEGLSDKTRIVPSNYNELVAVLNVRIFERNLANFLPPLLPNRADYLLLIATELRC